MVHNGQRQKLQEALGARLGGFAATPLRVTARRDVSTDLEATWVSELDLVLPDGTAARGVLTGPLGTWREQPAVLYCHAHGNRYDIGAAELTDGRPALRGPPYGEALAREGIVALAIDLPCFGTRAQQRELETAKRLLWQGRTLFGVMLEDLAGALTVLGAIEGVDPNRVGAFGVSMGATLAFWLAVLDHRIKAVAQLIAFADLATLVETDAHDRHGLYMTVPGLLATARTGEIAGLVAPRPQLVGVGLQDPLTPPVAVERAMADLTAAYRIADAAPRLTIVCEPASGHSETAAMRAAVTAFLRSSL